MIIDENPKNWRGKCARNYEVTIRFSHAKLFDDSETLRSKISKMKPKPSRRYALMGNASML